VVDIHDSKRFHTLVSGSLKNRTERNRCSSMPSIRGRSLSTSGSLAAAASRARWTSHHETPWAAAVSVAARPDSMTAETRVFCSRRVERARRGTSMVASKKVRRRHSDSSHQNRCLDQVTSTGPATGMSRIRCRRRECRRVPMTPQAGQPDSVVLSMWIRRWPKPRISVSRAQLRMDNEFLGKAAAFFASKQQNRNASS
jgi:hypothetical protein